MYINCLVTIRCSKWVAIIIIVRRCSHLRVTEVIYSPSKHVLGTCRVRQVFESKLLQVHCRDREQRNSIIDSD